MGFNSGFKGLRFKQSQCGQQNVFPRYEAEVISTAQQIHITVEHKMHIYDIQILNHRKIIPFHISLDVGYLHQKNTFGMSLFFMFIDIFSQQNHLTEIHETCLVT